MTLIRKINIADEAGNYIDSHQDADGDYHLGVAMIQQLVY